AAVREALLRARAERPPPLEDDKVLAGWNGLAIAALARATRVLRDPRWAAAGERAADFVLGEMVEDGTLRRSFRKGRLGPDAVLDDYAFLIAGLLDLYEATGRPRWLEAAISLQAVLDRRFADAERGG